MLFIKIDSLDGLLCLPRKQQEYSVYVTSIDTKFTIPPRKLDLIVKYYLNGLNYAHQFERLENSKLTLSHKFLTYAANSYKLSTLEYQRIDDFIESEPFSLQLFTRSYWKKLFEAVQTRNIFTFLFILILIFVTLLAIILCKICRNSPLTFTF